MLAKEDLFKQLKRLQEENEKAKEYIKDLQVRKDKYYLRTLNYETKISYLIQALEEIKEIAKYNQSYNPKYFMLRGDIGQIQNIKMTEIYEKCNEVLDDRD